MRDLREYARKTNLRLVAGTMALVLTVGLGLIAVFYGPGGALTGLVCVLAMAAPVSLIVLFLWGLEQLVRRGRRD